VLNDTPPAQCQAQCCAGSSLCTSWTSCVTSHCAAQCY
jgi:hypothetical protein